MKIVTALTATAVLGTLLSVAPAFAATTSTAAPTVSASSGFTAKTFVSGTASQSKPDDITTLNGNMIIAFQNGVPSTGGKGSSGATQSTIVEYGKTGKVVQQWNVTGKIDGMTADPANNRFLASVNEDGNSSLYVVSPGNATPQHLTYSGLTHGGGTDSIVVTNGHVYITASAPTPDKANGKTFSKPALYQANIDTAKGVVSLTPVLKDNAQATNVVTGKSQTLNLSDPDSNIVVPQISPKFAGDFMLDSQGDSQLIFIHNLGQSNQSKQVLQLNSQYQPDDLAWATSKQGTLYISDSGTNKVYAVTGNFTPGTVFVSLGSSVGTLDLNTGKVTPFMTGLSDSHGMKFISSNPGSTKTSTPVNGATSPKTGFPVEELIMEGLGLLSLGGGTTAAFLRKRKK